ncbi:MAG: choice-of-anchor Q domain-containing protein [Caldilineaceae bacterium]
MQIIRNRISLALAIGLLGLLGVATPAYADSVITVTTLDDGLVADAACSLREAVIAANTDAAFNGCAAGSGADTIVFDGALATPSVFVLSHTGSNENGAQTGDLDVSGSLTISASLAISSATSGPTPTVIVDGNHSDRVFHLLNNAQLTLTGITVQHGQPGGASNGGGILTELGARLTVNHSRVISNSAVSGGGIYGVGRVTITDSQIAENSGGGLTNMGGLFTLRNVEISHNSGGYGLSNQAQGALSFTAGLIADNAGGGLSNAGAQATVTGATLRGNSVHGGAVNTGAGLTRLTIADSLIVSNTATAGGGLLNEGVGASVSIYRTRISGNQATGSGGGLFNNGIMTLHESTLDHNQARAGGGLHHFGGNLSLLNDTLSQNDASDNGGGLYNGGSAVIKSVTLVLNRANGEGGNIFIDESQLSIQNSLVTQALDGDNCAQSGGFVTSLGHNLESANSCKFMAAGDLPNSDPKLGPLQNNGGPTPTHALLPGSPAIDAAANCPATDQRGLARPQGAACDIGAFEAGDVADLALAVTASADVIGTNQPLTYSLFITNLGPSSAVSVTLTDHLPAGVDLISTTVTSSISTTISSTLVSDGDCAPNGCLRWSLPALDAGASLSATIVINTLLTAGTLTNTAQIAGTTSDLNLANNAQLTLVTVAQEEGDLTPPGPVGNLTTTDLTATGVMLIWTPATDNVGVTGYDIWIQQDGPTPAPAPIGDTTALTFTVNALEPGTGYWLWVAAYDAAGNEADLSELTPIHITTLATLGVIRIVVEPPAPTISDAVSITVESIHRDSCVPHYDSHQIVDHDIAILSVPSGELFCLPAETPWDYSINVGKLAAGP